METRTTQTVNHQFRPEPIGNFNGIGNINTDEIARQRLNTLLAVNAETAREKSLFSTEKEKLEAELMKNPLTTEKSFAYFGILLGTFPPAAFFIRIFSDMRTPRGEDVWILGVAAIVILISSTVGFFSGKLIGRIVRESEKMSWLQMMLLLPFVGILWGILSGGAGGIIIFIVGAVFGALVGASVGMFALPLFTILHRLLKCGDRIEKKHFLPLAFGVTFIISAFMLGL
jgi:MFS family permease